MSDADINIAAASVFASLFPLISFSLVFVFFSLAPYFLSALGFRRGSDCARRNQGGCLSLDRGKDIIGGLRRLGCLHNGRRWKRSDLNHDAALRKNHKLLFTINEVLSHLLNEESVKHYVIKWILDKNQEPVYCKEIARCEGEAL